jgi:hypothetical protein
VVELGRRDFLPQNGIFSLIGNEKEKEKERKYIYIYIYIYMFLCSLHMHLTQTLAFFSLIRVLRSKGAILKIWGLTYCFIIKTP